MDPSTYSSGTPPHAVQQFATQLRKSAEAAIVKAYRLSLEGQGDGPSDAELRVFARLVAYETKLERRLAAPAPSSAQALDVPAGVQPSSPPAPVPRATETVASAPPVTRSRRALPITVLASSCVLVVVLAAMTSWIAGSGSPSATQAAAVVSQGSPMPAGSMSAEQIARPQADLAVQATARATARQASANDVTRKPPAVSTRIAGTARAQEIRSWSVVASCGGLNFLSRAICMNNVCAKPALTRSRSCADAVRQRRIDEARRNPLLMG